MAGLQGGQAAKPVEITVDASDFAGVVKSAKTFDRQLGNALRKQLRKAGDGALKAARAEVRKPPLSNGSGRSVGTRDAIARGMGLRIVTGKRAGIRIAATDRYLDGTRKGAHRFYNMATFRRPIFPNPKLYRALWQWTDQQGRPYFGDVIFAYRDEIRRDVEQALTDAVQAMRRST